MPSCEVATIPRVLAWLMLVEAPFSKLPSVFTQLSVAVAFSVVTEFRGRGDEIRIWPLTFDEYFSGIGGDIRKAWLDYYTFGGLPQVALLETEEKKTDYLRGLYETTYLAA